MKAKSKFALQSEKHLELGLIISYYIIHKFPTNFPQSLYGRDFCYIQQLLVMLIVVSHSKPQPKWLWHDKMQKQIKK